MTETVVHVTTLEQWKSVLDVWYKQGHFWLFTNTKYQESIFEDGGRFLFSGDCGDFITYSVSSPNSKPFIEYSEFMAQQKEDNKMATYYVTKERFDLIEELKSLPAPLVAIMNKKYGIETLYNELPLNDIEWFKYLSGSNQIEFRVKEQLYRLSRVDDADDKVYMRFTSSGNPDWTMDKDVAFTAPIEEIRKWKTPAWDIEKVEV
ncbi:hypothetical protein [Leuconostoc mesenteroides]|uniref:hypothetical protein n=1 Tax=Leuconostoc mesenteroides TaxID=1245 RepID=UPI001238C495|nr:hypothetical protein [Leuconostoc mesenteroides]KAA8366309.1 hypothetical protein FE417_09385 [Leuconostoc mesenteroides]